jgi:hypothetical protein
VTITNSTINSTTIGLTTPAAAAFTSASATTQPIGNNDLTTKLYVDSLALGISWKQPVIAATTGNITLSGTQTIDTVPVLAGERVLVKNQTNDYENGIYIAAAGPWSRSPDANSWDELISALVFVTEGGLAGSAWYCSAQPGGTLGVTAVLWNNFSVGGVYFAGTGLTLTTGDTFNIANTTVTPASYGSGSQVATFTVNQQGQLTAAANANIAIAATQITSGTIDSARISGSYTGITEVGTLTGLTVSATITGSISGNAATATNATNATTSTNLAGGATGSVPYQSGAGATTFVGIGTTGQVLTVAGGVPSWATPTTGTVTSIATAGTVSGITLTGGPITSSGTITLGGTLDLSSPPTIGNTAPNSGAFTTLSSTSDATIHGLIVGKGGGNVSNNTVLGVTALDSNTTGQQNVAIGINALTTTTTANNQTAVGYQALRLSTASDNTAVGSTALQSNTTGSANVAVGFQALTANTTGGSNTAVGRHALITNSTGTNLTALGNHAGAYETGSNALYIDAIDRTNTAGDKAGALLYGTFNSTPSSQTLTINGQVTLPYQLNVNSTIALGGSTGTAGYVLTSNGASAPTWQANASGLAIVDDTTTNATRYLTFTDVTTGNITTGNVSSTKLQFNPSTGVLTTTGSNITGLTASSAVATDASKNLVSVTNTGTGNNVLATSPTLTTPNIGAATATSVNGLTITSSTGTLTVTNGKTLSVSNTLTLAGTDSTTMTFPPTSSSIGYLNIPQSGSDKTTSYTLALGDIGEFVGVGSGGSITIPNSTFAAGDAVSIFNNTTGNITITCTITTAYIAGTDTDKATVTLATRGVCTVLFISGTVCVLTGNVS